MEGYGVDQLLDESLGLKVLGVRVNSAPTRRGNHVVSHHVEHSILIALSQT